MLEAEEQLRVLVSLLPMLEVPYTLTLMQVICHPKSFLVLFICYTFLCGWLRLLAITVNLEPCRTRLRIIIT